jgi:peptidoglycan-associated lipoprotein
MKKQVLFLPLLFVACSPGLKNKSALENNNISSQPVVVAPQAYVEPYLDKVYFDFDKYNIKKSEMDAVKTQIDYIKANKPNVAKVFVEGHADARGSVEYNLVLGQKRADSVMHHIKSAVKDKKVSYKTVSFGKSRLAKNGFSEEAHAANRRAVTLIEVK